MSVKKTKKFYFFLKKIVLKITMSMTIQQGTVERDPSLVIRRSAKRSGCLLLHLETGQPCDVSSSVVHSLHDQES